jgi:hypothetical protein
MTDPTQMIDDPEVVEALEVIAKDDPDGLVQPEKVVEAASNPDSPLHRYFEWSDSEAAHQYRLQQARKLVVRVVVKDASRKPIRVNVTIRKADGTQRRGYVPVERALTDEDMCAQVIHDVKRGLVSYRTRLAAFDQTQGIVAQLDNILELLP